MHFAAGCLVDVTTCSSIFTSLRSRRLISLNSPYNNKPIETLKYDTGYSICWFPLVVLPRLQQLNNHGRPASRFRWPLCRRRWSLKVNGDQSFWRRNQGQGEAKKVTLSAKGEEGCTSQAQVAQTLYVSSLSFHIAPAPATSCAPPTAPRRVSDSYTRRLPPLILAMP